MSDALVKRMREARMRWVDLGDGKRVRIIRPTEVQVSQQLFKGGEVSVEYADVVAFTVDWEGFSEADFLGAAIGSSDPLAFDSALWAEAVADRSAWVKQVATAILTAAVDHHSARTESAKNS